ncbi:ATP-binding cassette domain-containing protein, partial [bacterium]|nr:ATP-binding cassette domain-containing protein [bacterium]
MTSSEPPNESAFHIEGKNLKKSFSLQQQQITVLEDVNFTIERGKVVLIGGRSGVGKSTLLGLIGGLDRPTSGSILFENQNFENL